MIISYNNKILGRNNLIVDYISTPPGPSFDEVTIGSQTWMTSYLAIDDGQGGIEYNETTGLYYYNTEAATRVAETVNGWHLPTRSEINTLVSYIGSNNKSDIISVDDGGTDIYNLGLRLAGWYFRAYDYIGTYGSLVTADNYVWLFGLSSAQWYISYGEGLCNIRLIKDVN